MGHVGQLLLLGLMSMIYTGTEARCSSSQIECHTGGQCISYYHVCDSGRHCLDGSDEDPYVCEDWARPTGLCSTGSVVCTSWHDCRTIDYACSSSDCTSVFNSRMCEMVRWGKLMLPEPTEAPTTPPPPPKGMNMTSEIVTLLTTAVNTSLGSKKQDCPMLYIRVGQLCLALFSPAKVPWSEARQFCRSIYGDLVKFDNLSDYGDLVQYMRSSRLTTDFWVGGRFDLDTNAWSWTVDDSTMPLGSPYWAVRHSSPCVPRPPPHTDPFSSPAAALPGAPCFTYTQAPIKRQEGWCSAMTYEHYYYMSDQSCQEKRSPLCMLEADDDHPDGEA